jgi:DNA polymerase-3 subunit alpha
MNFGNYDCEKTWDLICEGRTKGVFQLESNLGKSWAKRTKPRNIEELAALISIIRPGCLKALSKGKSMTQHYVDRKSGKDEIEYIHECLEPILKNTQGVLIYQEQAMKISQVVAGFNLQEADDLRKAIGKKKADLMAKVKKTFLKGADEEGIVDNETAEEIFSWVEKSSRYSFNLSHGVSYSICAYWSAYYKAHNPIDFYWSYLYHSDGKQDPQTEVRELISDAKIHNINVFPPTITNPTPKFSINGQDINFGLQDIKFVGKSQVEKFFRTADEIREDLNKEVGELDWHTLLTHVTDKIGVTTSSALVSVGAMSHLDISRSKMLYDLETWGSLTNKEKDWVRENCRSCKTLIESLTLLSPTKKEGGGTFTVKRKEAVEDLLSLLKNPPHSIKDDPHFIASKEAEYLGASITYSKVDGCDVGAVDSTCKEIAGGKKGKVSLAVEIKRATEWTIKKGKSKGQKMAFLTVEDGTCELDNVVVFPEAWEEYKSIISEKNTVLIFGESQKHKDGLVVQKAKQI